MEQPISDLIKRRVAHDDRDRVTRLVAASRAANTSKAYRSRLKDYERWCRSRDLEMDECLTDEHVAAYIAERHAAGMKAKTLEVALAALRFACKNSGLPNPGGHLAVSALNGARRIDSAKQPAPAPALRREQVDAVLQVIDHELKQVEPGSRAELLAHRDAALLSLASNCLLRVSELCAVDVAHLTVEAQGDGLEDEDTGLLFVGRSKTDQRGRGEQLFVPGETVARLLDWLGAADISEGPVARAIGHAGHVRETRMSARHVNLAIRRRCEKAGFPGITCHALRRGMAESLSQAGSNTTEIMRAGRWRSAEMPARYTRGTAAREGAVARLYRQKRIGGGEDLVEAS